MIAILGILIKRTNVDTEKSVFFLLLCFLLNICISTSKVDILYLNKATLIKKVQSTVCRKRGT